MPLRQRRERSTRDPARVQVHQYLPVGADRSFEALYELLRSVVPLSAVGVTVRLCLPTRAEREAVEQLQLAPGEDIPTISPPPPPPAPVRPAKPSRGEDAPIGPLITIVSPGTFRGEDDEDDEPEDDEPEDDRGAPWQAPPPEPVITPEFIGPPPPEPPERSEPPSSDAADADGFLEDEDGDDEVVEPEGFITDEDEDGMGPSPEEFFMLNEGFVLDALIEQMWETVADPEGETP